MKKIEKKNQNIIEEYNIKTIVEKQSVKSRQTTKNVIHDDIDGAIIGGAAFGGIATVTGNIALASYSSTAIESLTNEVVSYTPLAGRKQKKLTSNNLLKSTCNIIKTTLVDGTATYLTGKIAGKSIKINKGWFKPKKMVSSFTGKYARKVWGQSAIQGSLLYGYQIAKDPIVEYRRCDTKIMMNIRRIF